MKHNFNTPISNTVKAFNGLPCDCVDCTKNAAYTKQLHDRNAVYVNSFDFPDFNDLKISATELLGRATGNPVAVVSAQAARNVKNTVNAEVKKVQAGGTTQWTNLPKSTITVDPEQVAPEGVTIDWLGWFGWKTKAVIVVIVAAVLVSMYLRATGK